MNITTYSGDVRHSAFYTLKINNGKNKDSLPSNSQQINLHKSKESFYVDKENNLRYKNINLTTLLRFSNKDEIKKISGSFDPNEYFSLLILNNFTPVIIKDKFFMSHIINNTIFFFNLNLSLVHSTDLTDLKKIYLVGRYSFLLKFYNEDNKLLKIKFLSNYQRENIVDVIIPHSLQDFRLYFRKLKIYELVKDNKYLLHQFEVKLIKDLRKNNMLYTHNIYDFLNKKHLNPNFDEMRLLLLIFSEAGFIKKIYNCIFNDIKIIKFDLSDFEDMYNEMLINLRTHKDSIVVTMKNRRVNRKKNINKIKDKFNYCKTEVEILNNSINEEISSKARPRHKNNYIDKRSLTNYVKHTLSPIGSLNEGSFKRPMFERIIFDVTTPRYFGKDQKVLEIKNNGFFMISKKGKNDNFLSYMLDDIYQMDGEASTNSLTLITMLKDIKKTTWLEFINPFEKYVFKTLVYNHFICSQDRFRQGNQLKLNVNIMTWNVAGIDVPSDLGIMFNTQTLEGIDIFTIGVQECSIFKIKDWQKHLKTLMSYYGYSDVTSIDMYQMFLIVFVKKDLKPFIENVSSSYKPMGFAKVIGNKGGIVIGFKFMGYQLTFVNCHLAPKPYKVLERNKHAKTLVKSIRIGEKFADFDIVADYLFWQGDLNYRVDYNFDETLREILKNNITLLLAKDQLLRQKQQNQVFYNFQEPEINFFPTYRRIKGTEEYSNKNNQSPSWCDRIMVKTDRELDMMHYDSVKVVKHSDHLPVLAKFSIYLTIPSFEDVEKTLHQNVSGAFLFHKIALTYDFTESFSELEMEPRFPLKLKLSSHFFINNKGSETKPVEINDLAGLENFSFDSLILNFPPQFIFDLPHSRALNIFFVLHIILNKTTYEIGYAKYSLENIERANLNLLTHKHKIDMFWRTRKFGTLSFAATYKF